MNRIILNHRIRMTGQHSHQRRISRTMKMGPAIRTFRRKRACIKIDLRCNTTTNGAINIENSRKKRLLHNIDILRAIKTAGRYINSKQFVQFLERPAFSFLILHKNSILRRSIRRCRLRPIRRISRGAFTCCAGGCRLRLPRDILQTSLYIIQTSRVTRHTRKRARHASHGSK